MNRRGSTKTVLILVIIILAIIVFVGLLLAVIFKPVSEGTNQVDNKGIVLPEKSKGITIDQDVKEEAKQNCLNLDDEFQEPCLLTYELSYEKVIDCEKYSEFVKNDCYVKVAHMTKDPSNCMKIMDENSRRLCEALAK